DDAARTDLDAPLAVKEAVLPFKRFRTASGQVVDTVLGPEMRSTGEVMGYDVDFPLAFGKSQAAAFGGLPTSGTVVGSVADRRGRAAGAPSWAPRGWRPSALRACCAATASRPRWCARPPTDAGRTVSRPSWT